MMGYLDDPESTLKTFTSDGYLKSGDIGYISEVCRGKTLAAYSVYSHLFQRKDSSTSLEE